jgi:hypothetical protein
MAVHDAFSA